MIKNLKVAIPLLIIAIGVWTVHFLYFHGGYFGYDDMEYCRLAALFSSGQWIHDSQYAFRYGIVIPLMISYLMFGVGDFSNFITGLFPLCGMLLWLIYICRNLKPIFQWTAVLFFCVTPMHLMYLEKPMPDLMVAFGFFTAFCALYFQRYDPQRLKFRWQIFVSGIIITILSKETMLVFYPYFVGIAIYDFYKKQHIKFWISAVVALSLFLILYLASSYLIFGDPFIRIKAIYAGQYFSPCAYDKLPVADVLKRIGYQLWLDFVRNGLLIPLAFTVSLLRVGDKKLKFISVSFLALLLLSNFMTISYTAYVPLCPDPRHFMFIIPIGTLIVAFGTSTYSGYRFVDMAIMVIMLGIQLYLSVYFDMEHTWWLFLPLIVSTFLLFSSKIKGFFGFWLVGMVSIFIQNAQYNLKVNYTAQRELNMFAIDNLKNTKVIITDPVNTNIGNFHLKYDTLHTRFVTFKVANPDTANTEVKIYLLINGMTNYLSNTNYETLPEYIKNAEQTRPKIYNNQSGSIYSLNRPE